jgi:hypothetical protein
MTDTTPKQSVGIGCLGMIACMAVFPILHLQAILRPDAQPTWIGIDPKSGEQVRAGYIFFAIFDGDARNSAAAVRRFCEAGGGRDCS